MAVDFLEDIYQYSKLVSDLRQVIDYIRTDCDHHAVMRLNELFPQIFSLCKKAVETEYSEVKTLWENVKEVRSEDVDLTRVGDLLEKEIVPRMELWIQSLGKIVQEVDDTYVLESSDSGFLTMRSICTSMYIHSRNNPMDVARKYVAAHYDASKRRYSVFGCGMGYHIYMLYKESGGAIPITVYEEDARAVEYARDYGVLDWIPRDKINIVTQDSVMAFLKSIEDGASGALIYVPSVKQMKNDFERELMMGVVLSQKTINSMGKDIVINSWRNLERNIRDVTEIRSEFNNDEAVIVAAGPSLDDSMEKIREWQGEKRIICVGTVFKKLLSNGIRPDYVVVIDPQERTLRQIEDVENETIPMILGVAAHWGFAEKYKGEKYIAYTCSHDAGVQKKVSEVAKEIWPSGGTVTYMALETAIRMGVKKIYLVGVDLAFPGGVTHATDTLDRTTKKTDKLLEVCGVGGTRVYTDRVFSSYREEMEKRISQAKGVKFYNLSKVGARIKGTIEMK